MTLQTDDPNAKPSPTLNITLTQGTTTFLWNWVTKRNGLESTPAFSAATATATGFNTGFEHLTVDPDITKHNLQILVQGETLDEGTGYFPSGTGGKISALLTFAAGQSIPITVRMVDDYWNLTESNALGQATIYVQGNDPNVSNPLVNGSPIFYGNGVFTGSVQLLTQSTTGYVLTASGTASGQSLNVNVSSPVVITASTLSKLQILVPGETAVQGNVSIGGKSGVPQTQTAGTPFNVPIGYIRAVDAFYNTVSTNGVVTVTMADPYGAPQSQNVNISGGTSASAFPITLAISTQTFTPQVLYVNGFNLATSTSSAIPVNTGATAKLQLVLPGETAVPGSGKSGSPQAVSAGVPYPVTVNLVDSRYNKISQLSQPNVNLSVSDVYATFSPNPPQTLGTNGQQTFNVTFQAANTSPGWQVFVATASGSAITNTTADTSNFVVVNPTTTDHILLVLPGEIPAPGSPRGFLQSPSAATAGVAYISTVTFTDRFYNAKTDVTSQISMITTDPYATPSSGTLVLSVTNPTAFALTFHKAPGPWTINVSTVSGAAVLVSTTSDPVTVQAAPAAKLQVLLPGQTANSGQPPYDNGQNGGYTGSPEGNLGTPGSPFTAGQAFNVTVNLVDNYFNQSQAANTFVVLTTTDPYATLGFGASQQTGQSGTIGQTVFNVAMQTRNPTGSSGWEIYASTATGDPYATGVSTWVVVQANTPQKLLVLAPGESSVEGNTSGGGKSGTPTAPGGGPFTAGTTYFVQVRSVDAFYNIVTGTSPVVTLTSDDSNAVPLSSDNPKAMTSGVVTIPFVLPTAEVYPNGTQTTTLTAAAPGYAGGPYQSGGLVMAPTSYSNIQLLVPGETGAPGNVAAAGKIIGTITTQAAGVPFRVTVRAVDRFFNNTNTLLSGGFALAGTDPHDSRPGEYQLDPLSITVATGTLVSNWTFTTANGTGWQLIASGPAVADTSPNIPVVPGAPETLQVVLPGETAVPGLGTYNLNGTGRTGTAQSWVSGVSSNVVVNVVDKHFNVVSGAVMTAKVQNNTDVFVAPQTVSFTGTTTYAFTLLTATASTSFTATKQSGAPLDASSSTVTSSTFTVNANSAVKLQILVPGETALPGSPTGKSSVGISTQAAGVAFPVTVNAVDLNFNVVPANAQVFLTSNDPFASSVGPQNLAGGTTVFQMVFVKASTAPGWTLNVSTTSGSFSGLTAAQSAVVPVNPGAAARLQIVLPNQTTVPGNVAIKGRTGTPTTAVAGLNYNVTVNLTDLYYNLQPGGAMPSVQLLPTDPNSPIGSYGGGNPQSLSGATATFGAILTTSGTWTFTASTTTGANYLSDTSANVPTIPGAPTKLLTILPGQTPFPGTLSGLSGSANPETAGNAFTATVYVTDQYSNQVSTGRNPVFVYTSDPYDIDPGSFSLTNGQVSVSNVNPFLAGITTLYAVDNDTTSVALTQAVSTFTVTAAAASQIQLVLPGETAVPGNLALSGGVTGTPTIQPAGQNFNVTANLVDAFWNPASAATGTVTIMSSDPNNTSTGPWVSNGKDPVTIQISTGSTIFADSLITATTTGWTLTATSTYSYTTYISSAILVQANPTGFQRNLLALLPGESPVQGTATGKTGTVLPYTVGSSTLNVVVMVTDKFFNTITVPPALAGANTATVQISILNNADPYAQIPSLTQPITAVSGQATFSNMTLFKATTEQFVMTDVTAGHAPPWTQSTSSVFTAAPKPAKNLLLLLANETATPGSGIPGKTGSVNSVVAGSTFPATVEVVDQYFNPVITHNSENLKIITSDTYGLSSATQTFVNGQSQGSFVLQMRTAGGQTATAVDTNILDPGTTWTASTSPVSGTFTVSPGAASQLLVVLPGETYVAGSPTGRTGTPTQEVAGTAFTVTIYQTDAEFNLVATGTMPKIQLTGNDAGVVWVSPVNPSPLLAGQGFINFSVQASSAQPAFVVTASTTPDSPAGTGNVQMGISSSVRVWPGTPHHLQFTNLPTPPLSVQAGQLFGGCIVVEDQYNNVVSSGPYTDTTTLTQIAFNAQTTTNGGLTDALQNPPLSAWTTSYNLIQDGGVLCLTNYFSLYAAGSDWIEAYDTIDPSQGISTEVVGYSTRPYITVNPGPPSRLRVTPNNNVQVPAGRLSLFGSEPISAKLSDAYDNFTSSAGVVIQLSISGVSGSTGTISFDVNASSSAPPTPATSAVTDSSGTIGLTTPLVYYVSHAAGDYAQVQFQTQFGALVDSGTTNRMTTTGGDTTQLAVIAGPTSQTAGQAWNSAPALSPFTLQREDDFSNPTSQGNFPVVLDDNTDNGQAVVHEARGFNPPPAHHDFEFEDLSGNWIGGITFSGVSTVQFLYFDRMSSTPSEDGRTGAWTLQAYNSDSFDDSNVRTQWNLVVNPGVTARLGFHNPVRTLQAGLPFNPSGNINLSALNLELQDANQNPTITASTVTVNLTSYRVASPSYDAYGFSASSAILPSPPPTAPGFVSPSAAVLIASGTWSTTFYYLDTNASENYAVPASSPLLDAWVNGTSWSTGTQTVNVLPGSIYRIGMLNAPGSLTAGATSQTFLFAAEDIFGNPSAITSNVADAPANTSAAFQLTSNSTGTIHFASPLSTSTYSNGPGTAVMPVGQSTMTFYMIDTLAGNHTLSVARAGSGWVPSISTYTVNAAPASQLVFITPSHYLVAGTTLQYEPNYLVGSPTNTVITAQSEDPFGNMSFVSSLTVVSIFVDNVTTATLPSNGAYAGIDPTNLSSFVNIAAGTLQPPPLNTNTSQVNFYYYDMVEGTHTLVAHDNSGHLTDARITNYISPAPVAYFTIEPNSQQASPMPVNTLLPFGTFTARDQFGNPATGDPKNGQYYTGTMYFSTNGSTQTVTLADASAPSISTNSYTFKISDHGVYSNLLISDSIQETLQINATDFVTLVPPVAPGNNAFDKSETIVRGWTHDTARSVPVHSLGNVVTAGIVMTPTDLSPVPATDPTYAAKFAALNQTPWQGDTQIYEGQGNLNLTNNQLFRPMPVMMLTFGLQPISYSSSTVISRIQLTKQTTPGALGDPDVTQVSLYWDSNHDNQLEAEECFNCSPQDTLIATTTIVSGVATFSNLNISISTGVAQNYFVTVRISSNVVTSLPANLGFGNYQPQPDHGQRSGVGQQ